MTAFELYSDWRATVFSSGASPFVTPAQPALAETVTIRLRVARDSPVRQVILYAAPDGEAWEQPMSREPGQGFLAYHQCQFPLHWKIFRYHFILITDDQTVWHYIPGRVQKTEPIIQHESFTLLADAQLPDWVPNSIIYQIFPDRFANGDPSRDYQSGEYQYNGWSVTPAEWGEPPRPYQEAGNLDFYSGDLAGILQRLDYLQDLGVDAVYCTPIFTAPSNHRYDVQDFYEIDPHLGDESVLVQLTQALHGRGMRMIIDGVFNHTGMTSRWFNRGRVYPEPGAYQAEPSPYDDFYMFHNHPNSYESWWGIATLPKLDFRSQKLRDTIYGDRDSVVQYWLQPPRSVDGWRFDVANMTARHRAYQGYREVWSELRTAVKARFPDAYLLGEHSQDGTELLQGDCFDGLMNYQGFLVPLFYWLIGAYGPVESQHRAYANFTHMEFQEQISTFLYAVPWQIALMMYNAIDTHDRPRFLTASGDDRFAYRSAIVLLFSFVGVPAVYYGDEVGLPGSYDPDNRRCMPWNPAEWDTGLQDLYRTFIGIRKNSSALCRGSFQWLAADAPAVCFARFDDREIMITLVLERASDTPVAVSLRALGVRAGEVEGLSRGTQHAIEDFTVMLPPVAEIYLVRS
jgi:alpha-glucosidase